MRRIYLSIPVVVLSIFVYGTSCTGAPASVECTDTAPPAEDAFSSTALSGTRWLYQLQETDPTEVAGTDFDIIVTDYSRDGSEDGRYSSDEMDVMKAAGKDRTVLAYLSIGEAEDYRYYFDSSWTGVIGSQPSAEAPCWLGQTNPEWRGNYKVQYWSEDWQNTIFDYLDKIIDDGFDGVYLDIIDAYEYWGDEDNGEGFYLSEEEAAAKMINFVKGIAYHARTVRGETDFLIIPQNGEGILEYDTGTDGLGRGDFLNTVNGIGIEDLYYWETDAIDPDETAGRKKLIDQIRDAGKTVLVVDYVDEGSEEGENTDRINDFISRCETDGYLPFPGTTDRELAAIPR